MEINRHNSNLLWFDLQPNGEQEFITIYILLDDKITLIETGPACSHSNLVEGINKAGIALSEIDFIVPTHIHLDHFGGGGHIMQVCENAKAIVHPKAVRHVSNIDKWWSGSLDFLGEVAKLYDKPLPIPESRIISAENGFEAKLGKTTLKALHTPGHAPHHITWINNNSAFVGDSLGLWYKEIGKAFPVTPGYYRHDLA
ncbi:MAG: MBL fold metallo-hydrolase, partial [Candidatus Thermoplasmatota archaeon]|nr:MBL fold metallo-hydrolase [Candidatus Thermoplasmatota archaeon]